MMKYITSIISKFGFKIVISFSLTHQTFPIIAVILLNEFCDMVLIVQLS